MKKYTLNNKVLYILLFLLSGCFGSHALDPENPDEYFNYWCDPSNYSNSYRYNSNYYEFHEDSEFVSKDECMNNKYYGVEGTSNSKNKQLDDNLDEQIEEARDRSSKK